MITGRGIWPAPTLPGYEPKKMAAGRTKNTELMDTENTFSGVVKNARPCIFTSPPVLNLPEFLPLSSPETVFPSPRWSDVNDHIDAPNLDMAQATRMSARRNLAAADLSMAMACGM